MDNNIITGDMDLFVDNQPMNDEELSKLHESTLQMFRSNKIGPKNAFDIVLIDYLPAIFEGTHFDDDHINNFQSVGTTLETSAKIYAARIDSLYSETRKTQSILCSTNENLNRLIDDDDDFDGINGENEEDFSQRRISNNKKIRLLMKRKKSIVTDRNKLLRKNRTDEYRPIMINQFFLSAMNNDNIMLSELYDKMNISLTIDERKKSIKTDQNDILSSSLHSNDFISDSLFIDTSNLSNDNDLSPSSDLNSTIKSSQLLTPNSFTPSTTMNLTSITPIRSRTNSISSNSNILTNAANLLTDTPNEYSYLDSTKVNAFINEINNNNPIKIDEMIISSPTKLIRKRRLSIEYPFPFLVEQAKKQRITPKKLREELLKQQQRLLRPPSPEYSYSLFDNTFDFSSDLILPQQQQQQPNLNVISKRQRAIDFRHLQTNMQKIISKNFENNNQLVFSDIYLNIHQDDNRIISSSDIGICFAALLNNAVRYQLELQSNDIQDDIRIFSSKINNKH